MNEEATDDVVENDHSRGTNDSAAMRKLLAYGYSQNDISHIVVSHTSYVESLQKRIAAVPTGDDLARVLRIFEMTDSVFETRQKAQHWLRTSCRALQGAKPLDLLQSVEGAQLVEDELIRIEHGIYY